MGNSSPCKDCTKRHRACWDHCEAYSKWKEERRKLEAKQKEYKLRRREDFLHSEECERVKRKWRAGMEHGEQ